MTKKYPKPTARPNSPDNPCPDCGHKGPEPCYPGIKRGDYLAAMGADA